jgi:hypothetical protein
VVPVNLLKLYRSLICVAYGIKYRLHWESPFCGLLRRVVWWLDTSVSEDRAASIFRVEGRATGTGTFDP